MPSPPPRRDFGWPPFSVARLRRFVVGAVITESIVVWMLGGLASMAEPLPPAVVQAHVAFFGLMLAAVGAIAFSLLAGPPEATRWSALRVAAAVACAAGPLWLVWVSATS